MKKIIQEKGSHLLKAFVPAKVLQSRMHRRIFMNFAERTGLVYFGYVDQRDDEHRLIRGLTVSSSHRDNHYCIGSFGGYDIALVERRDTIRFPGKPARNHTWVIMTFDLHTSTDLPHIFIGLHTHSPTFYAQLFTKFAQLNKIPYGVFGANTPEFTERYAVYSEPAKFVATEQLLRPDVTKALADSFGSMTIEIVEGCLYVYAEHQRPSQGLLDRMLKNGLWLAKAIDTSVDQESHRTLS